MDKNDSGMPKRLRLTKETLRFFAAEDSAPVGTNTFSGQCFTAGCTGNGATCLNQTGCLSNSPC